MSGGRFRHIISLVQVREILPNQENALDILCESLTPLDSRYKSMPEFADPVLDVETIRRFASDDVMLPLSPAELDAIHSVLNPLIGEIRQVTLSDRAGAEPEMSIVVEEWPA